MSQTIAYTRTQVHTCISTHARTLSVSVFVSLSLSLSLSQSRTHSTVVFSLLFVYVRKIFAVVSNTFSLVWQTHQLQSSRSMPDHIHALLCQWWVLVFFFLGGVVSNTFFLKLPTALKRNLPFYYGLVHFVLV